MMRKLIIITLLILSLFVSTVNAIPIEKVSEYLGKTVLVTILGRANSPESIIGLAYRVFRVKRAELTIHYLTVITKNNVVNNLRIDDIYDVKIFEKETE